MKTPHRGGRMVARANSSNIVGDVLVFERASLSDFARRPAPSVWLSGDVARAYGRPGRPRNNDHTPTAGTVRRDAISASHSKPASHPTRVLAQVSREANLASCFLHPVA